MALKVKDPFLNESYENGLSVIKILIINSFCIKDLQRIVSLQEIGYNNIYKIPVGALRYIIIVLKKIIFLINLFSFYPKFL